MGRLLEDSSGVILGRIASRGDISVEKLGDAIGAPKCIFGKDTGEVERIVPFLVRDGSFPNALSAGCQRHNEY